MIGVTRLASEGYSNISHIFRLKYGWKGRAKAHTSNYVQAWFSIVDRMKRNLMPFLLLVCSQIEEQLQSMRILFSLDFTTL